MVRVCVGKDSGEGVCGEGEGKTKTNLSRASNCLFMRL